METFCKHCGENYHTDEYCPKHNIEAPILSWREAAVLWGQGVEIEFYGEESNKWIDYDTYLGVTFRSDTKYRRKPAPPQKDYRLDQGFQEGDVVMMRDKIGDWCVFEYIKYEGDFHMNSHGMSCMYARPLTSDEYKKVRVME